MSDDAARRAWAYLARVAEPPAAPVIDMIAALGVSEAAAAVRRRKVPDEHREVLAITASRADTDQAQADLDTAERIGARLVTPADDEWPAWSLMALGQADTAARGGVPLALWVRGPARLDDIAAACVALVGSRAASSYGEHVTATVASGLCDNGFAVLSGGAFGIDGAAHRAALGSGGTTAAVMACGIDRDYPAAHAQLLREIARVGAVISEYPPGTTAAKHRFLTRNRLVAALGGATVVVEAGRRSGAANTAAWARKLGRPLGAVPGPVTSVTSVGCHQMIADQLATLVVDAAAVIRLVRPDGEGVMTGGRARATDALSAEQKRVHDALPARGAVTIGEIAFSAGLELPAVRTALARLEVTGLIDGDGARWWLV
ncbi:DNA protecting protein DprA [Gordonia bronchialis DSM 43247]|uniref:DNA protecting protein DprA n=1 Tax=Gordonia bronchialis (strain ATCC 25592 / DSM 43247 / BCRC 13721 / JCM 3198 / KCTC 3076 / NBRC 16047 / NCTC 10667) TaxID=526226 RepID=D0LAN6_GORB4|nr:DNA protecting protein DprA [Gordonia bronchialis DSM 43247]STQ64223.1 Transposase and inactivated derivatives [Gordonia bronchialis]